MGILFKMKANIAVFISQRIAMAGRVSVQVAVKLWRYEVGILFKIEPNIVDGSIQGGILILDPSLSIFKPRIALTGPVSVEVAVKVWSGYFFKMGANIVL